MNFIIFVLIISIGWLPLTGCKVRRETLSKTLQAVDDEENVSQPGDIHCGSQKSCAQSNPDDLLLSVGPSIAALDDENVLALDDQAALLSPEQRQKELLAKLEAARSRLQQVLKDSPGSFIKSMVCTREYIHEWDELRRRDPKTGDFGSGTTGHSTRKTVLGRIIVIFQSYSEAAVQERCRYLFEKDPVMVQFFTRGNNTNNKFVPTSTYHYSTVTTYNAERLVDEIKGEIMANTRANDSFWFNVTLDSFYHVNWTFLYDDVAAARLAKLKWAKANRDCQHYNYKVASTTELALIREEVLKVLNEGSHTGILSPKDVWTETGEYDIGNFRSSFSVYNMDTGEEWVKRPGTLPGDPVAHVICIYTKG